MASLEYAYPWDALITRWKFGGDIGWTGFWAHLMLRNPQTADLLASEALQTAPLMVPIPIGARRLAERGFNQSWELTKSLQRRLPAPRPMALADALVRVRDTPDQHSLPRAQRLQNLQGAFAVHPKHRPTIAQRSVLLIDDVSTTGATLEAAAKALLDAGAARICALVLARTPP